MKGARVDAGERGGQCDLGERGAFSKRVLADGGDAGVNADDCAYYDQVVNTMLRCAAVIVVVVRVVRLMRRVGGDTRAGGVDGWWQC